MSYKIPLAKPYFDSEELAEIRKVLDSGWVARGPKVKEFETEIAGRLNIKYAIAVTNCTSALHLSLLALGIREGDEVLVADYTFPATGHAVLHCKAKPVFVDVDLKTYNVDPGSIPKKITRKTKAIIPVHTFGQPAEMDKIMKIADKHGLWVIEDAACAFGAKYKNKFAGTIGDIGCFSLHGRKGITTGEGGIVVTDSKDLSQRVKSLSAFGMTALPRDRKSEDMPFIPRFTSTGYNYKMSDVAAALGIAQLRKLAKITKRKRSLAGYWYKKLKKIKFIACPHVSENTTHVYQSYVVLIDKRIDRDKMIEMLMKKGIQVAIGTYASHLQPVYDSKDKCPNSSDAFKRALALPIYYTLEEKDIDIATEIIEEVLEKLK
ncbi:MAG: DegT/DnrJ/EryC1/StrS family aminotransferase [Omnitrophica bacterium]|nr:DegT/DnrJ/EryC1/StrS family aminotransferase [Candidatus Omnitrophota bacterium]